MKKIFSSRIFSFILGSIIFSSMTVFAYSLQSNDISYIPENSNWEVTNVEEAITDLYEYSHLNIIEKLSLETTSNSSQGYRILNRTSSLDLEKGNYILIGTRIVTTPVTAYEESSASINVENNVKLNYSNENANCNILHTRMQTAVATELKNDYYNRTISVTGIWECTFNEATTVSAIDDKTQVESSQQAATVSLYSIKLD